MANPEHVKIVRKGAEAIRKWREENPETPFDLSEAELSKVDLSPIGMNISNLQYANLTGANLSESNLRMVKFKGANLSGVSLFKAYLSQTDLTKVELTDAWIPEAIFDSTWLFNTNLEGSLLLSAKFRQCFFENTRMSKAKLGLTVFADCDLRGILDLDKIDHYAPSTVGIDTILRSEGDIPPEFLRGCGLPDHVIDYVKSLAVTPIQFYSCFISHSSKDEPFPKHLFDKLQGAGVRCWYFREHARTGEKLRDEIEGAIKFYDKLVVICSANSLSSQPVVDEIQKALQEEKAEAIRRLKDHDRVDKGELSLQDFENRRYRTRILFPIMIDDYLLKHWKHHLQVELSERVVADFRGWENFDKFDKEFKKLLKDLNEREES